MSKAGYILTKEGSFGSVSMKVYKSTDAATASASWTAVHTITDTLSNQVSGSIYVKSDTEIYFAVVISDSGQNKVRVYKSTDSGSSVSTVATSSSLPGGGGQPAISMVGTGDNVIVTYGVGDKFLHTTDGSTFNERDLSDRSALHSNGSSHKIVDVDVLSATNFILLVESENMGTKYISLVYLTSSNSGIDGSYAISDSSGHTGTLTRATAVVAYDSSNIYVLG